MLYVGWAKGNVISFITATTLARHKEKTKNQKLLPFTYGSHTLHKNVEKRNYCYIIGSFEGGEIDFLVSNKVKAVLIGKVHDGKYSSSDKFRISTVIVYPVPTVDLYGFEYLATLVKYFNVVDEAKFFIAMLKNRRALARVLAVTDAWIPAYELLTTREVVENPSVADIRKVLSYIARKYSYASKYFQLREKVLANTIVKSVNYSIIDVGEDDPKRYVFVAHDAYPKHITIAILSRIKTCGIYKIVVSTRGKFSSTLRAKVKKVLGGEVRGSSERFTVRVPLSKSESDVIKSLSAALSPTSVLT